MKCRKFAEICGYRSFFSQERGRFFGRHVDVHKGEKGSDPCKCMWTGERGSKTRFSCGCNLYMYKNYDLDFNIKHQQAYMDYRNKMTPLILSTYTTFWDQWRSHEFMMGGTNPPLTIRRFGQSRKLHQLIL